jgi:putative DNA primase/helicase
MESLFPNIKNIPDELKELPQWVVFKIKKLPADLITGKIPKPRKIPFNPKTGRTASPADLTTWGTFKQALSFWANKRNWINGLGFVFSENDPFTGIDLDHCIDLKNNKIEPWANDIIQKLNSYTEISPNGDGVHILVKGKLNISGHKKGNIEIYSNKRYFTITGNHLPDTPTSIEKRQQDLNDLHKIVFGDQKSYQEPNNQTEKKSKNPFLAHYYRYLSDDELIDKTHQAANGELFGKLWRADISGYQSQNEADLALCGMLAFWTERDYERIDTLFRQSKLFRPKWDKRHRADGATYGQMTIDKALYGEDQKNGNPFLKKGIGSSNLDQQPPPQIEITDLVISEAQASGGTRGFHLTDLGNAMRLVVRHGKDIRYCYIVKKWLVWDSKRWIEDCMGWVERMAKETARSIYAEASKEENEERRNAIIKHGHSTESEFRQKAMISTAQSEAGIPILPNELDQAPWLFNVINGTIDLKTGKLHPHKRENLITRLAPVEYNPEALCPNWWGFLKKVSDGDEALMEYIQKVVGYLLTGSTREQCLFFLYGLGKNGKSTFLIVIRFLFGDYGKHTSTETFLVKKFGGISNGIAALRGARLVTAAEVESGRQLSEATVKEITGGDPITARFLYGEDFTYMPEYKIFISTNHKPKIKGADEGIWRRIRLVPFTVQISDEETIPDLAEKLKEELPGILNWALKGCSMWQQEGLEMPEVVKKASHEYREEMDILADFLREKCIVDKRMQASSRDLYTTYTEWAENNGEKKPLSKRSFGMALTERGFKRHRGAGGVRIWKGIGVAGQTDPVTEETESDLSLDISLFDS